MFTIPTGGNRKKPNQMKKKRGMLISTPKPSPSKPIAVGAVVVTDHNHATGQATQTVATTEVLGNGEVEVNGLQKSMAEPASSGSTEIEHVTAKEIDIIHDTQNHTVTEIDTTTEVKTVPDTAVPVEMAQKAEYIHDLNHKLRDEVDKNERAQSSRDDGTREQRLAELERLSKSRHSAIHDRYYHDNPYERYSSGGQKSGHKMHHTMHAGDKYDYCTTPGCKHCASRRALHEGHKKTHKTPYMKKPSAGDHYCLGDECVFCHELSEGSKGSMKVGHRQKSGCAKHCHSSGSHDYKKHDGDHHMTHEEYHRKYGEANCGYCKMVSEAKHKAATHSAGKKHYNFEKKKKSGECKACGLLTCNIKCQEERMMQNYNDPKMNRWRDNFLIIANVYKQGLTSKTEKQAYKYAVIGYYVGLIDMAKSEGKKPYEMKEGKKKAINFHMNVIMNDIKRQYQ